jgi:hypothetical protein
MYCIMIIIIIPIVRQEGEKERNKVTTADASAVVTCHNGGCVRGDHMSQGRMRPRWSHVTRADASAVVTCHKGGCVHSGHMSQRRMRPQWSFRFFESLSFVFCSIQNIQMCK